MEAMRESGDVRFERVQEMDNAWIAEQMGQAAEERVEAEDRTRVEARDGEGEMRVDEARDGEGEMRVEARDGVRVEARNGEGEHQEVECRGGTTEDVNDDIELAGEISEEPDWGRDQDETIDRRVAIEKRGRGEESEEEDRPRKYLTLHQDEILGLNADSCSDDVTGGSLNKSMVKKAR